MIWAARQIGAPIKYLRIKQGYGLFTSKATYDWVIPGFLVFPAVAISIHYGPNGGLFSENGLIGGFAKLLEIMVPFFIASLAAVATFERKGMDEVMKGSPATLRICRYGEDVEVPLTRRQFVSYLFGYLSFLSLMLFIVILFLRLVGTRVGGVIAFYADNYFLLCKIAVLSVVYFFLWQLVTATLLGIYFLSERLQTMDDPER